jgi:hypothetical protein
MGSMEVAGNGSGGYIDDGDCTRVGGVGSGYGGVDEIGEDLGVETHPVGWVVGMG